MELHNVIYKLECLLSDIKDADGESDEGTSTIQDLTTQCKQLEESLENERNYSTRILQELEEEKEQTNFLGQKVNYLNTCLDIASANVDSNRNQQKMANSKHSALQMDFDGLVVACNKIEIEVENSQKEADRFKKLLEESEQLYGKMEIAYTELFYDYEDLEKSYHLLQEKHRLAKNCVVNLSDAF